MSGPGSAAARASAPDAGTDATTRLLAAIVEHSYDAVTALSLDGHILEVNAAAERAYGWPRAELIGRHVSLRVPEDRLAEIDEISDAVRRGEAVEMATQRVRRDGSVIDVLLSASPVRDDRGDVVAIATSARDVSELRRAEHRFEQLLEAAPDAIVIVRADGTVDHANRVAHGMFGYGEGAMTGLAVEDLLPPAVRARHVGHRAAFAADARVRPMGAGAELTAVRADGSTFPVEISLSPLQTDEGLLVTAVVRDITERKAAERRLVQQATELARSNAELEQFAYVASHDLQEPLRKVASFCQLLEQQYGDALDDKARLYIDYAVDGARRMQQLINDLLEYSRAGRAAADPEPVDLAAAVTRAVRNLETAIEEAHADVRIGPLPTLLGEGPRVVQLLQNLIGNAVKYRSRERPLRVDVLAEPVEHGVAVVVRDNGIGIRPEFADRIFEVFRRLHSREEYPGTGIGLALCRRIVERMGGTLVVESDGTSGSTFRAVLPAERVVRTA